MHVFVFHMGDLCVCVCVCVTGVLDAPTMGQVLSAHGYPMTQEEIQSLLTAVMKTTASNQVHTHTHRTHTHTHTHTYTHTVAFSRSGCQHCIQGKLSRNIPPARTNMCVCVLPPEPTSFDCACWYLCPVLSY